MNLTEKMYSAARELYASLGIDTEKAMASLDEIPLSIHAWQGDDVVGFEDTGHALTGGCQVTGNYPGRARTSEELRQDLDVALKLLPGKKLRVCLQGHEMDMLRPGQDRDTLDIENFAGWLDWAADREDRMDIAPAYYFASETGQGTLPITPR